MLPYLKLLIRQRIAAWNIVGNMRAGKHRRTAGVFAVVGFCLGVVSLYAMLVALEYFLFEAFRQLGEPQTMLALTALLCTVMTVITSFFYILSELFFSKDLIFVSALPISSRQLLTAKLLRIWIGEALIALAICMPAVILYGVTQASGALFYLKAVLLTLFVPLVPIALVTFISFLLIRVSALWKRREALTVVASMLFLVLIMWGQMSLSMSSTKDEMGEAILQMLFGQKHVLDLLIGFYPPVQWLCNALVGDSLSAAGNGLMFVGLNFAALALVASALGGGYQRLAIRQNEIFTRQNAAIRKGSGHEGVRTPLTALYQRELREIFIVPIYAMNCLASAVMFPVIAVVMLAGAGNGATELAALPMLLTLIPKPLAVAIATGIFALTTSMNMAISTSVSREGKRHEFFRTLPVAPQLQLFAKLLMGLTLNLISVLPLAILAFVALPSFRMQMIAGLFCSALFSTGTTIFELLVDVAHPKFGWKNETEAIKQNGLAALTMFGSMAFFAACGAAIYGLTLLRLPMADALIVICVVMLALDALLIKHLLGRSSRTYILQEVQN